MSCVESEAAYWRNIFLQRYNDTNTISKFLIAGFVTFPFLLVGERQGRDCSLGLHDTIVKHKAILDQLRKGLSILGLQKELERAPDKFEHLFVHKDDEVSAAYVKELLKLPTSSDAQVQHVVQMLYAFLQNTSKDDLLDFLCFVTGSRSSTSMFVPGSIGLSIGNTESIFGSTWALLSYIYSQSIYSVVQNVWFLFVDFWNYWHILCLSSSFNTFQSIYSHKFAVKYCHYNRFLISTFLCKPQCTGSCSQELGGKIQEVYYMLLLTIVIIVASFLCSFLW